MSKLTLEEKRLQQIRQQLFGKERPSTKASKSVVLDTKVTSTPNYFTSVAANNLGEARYLKQDISKVIILSILAVAGQFILHYLSTQGIINLNVLHLF